MKNRKTGGKKGEKSGEVCPQGGGLYEDRLADIEGFHGAFLGRGIHLPGKEAFGGVEEGFRGHPGKDGGLFPERGGAEVQEFRLEESIGAAEASLLLSVR